MIGYDNKRLLKPIFLGPLNQNVIINDFYYTRINFTINIILGTGVGTTYTTVSDVTKEISNMSVSYNRNQL